MKQQFVSLSSQGGPFVFTKGAEGRKLEGGGFSFISTLHRRYGVESSSEVQDIRREPPRRPTYLPTYLCYSLLKAIAVRDETLIKSQKYRGAGVADAGGMGWGKVEEDE